MLKHLTILMAFLVPVVLLSLTTSIALSAEKEVKIGALHPLTGFLAHGSNQLKEGHDIAVEEINAAGGIKSLGRAKLVVLHADSQGKAEVRPGRSRTSYPMKRGGLDGLFPEQCDL